MRINSDFHDYYDSVMVEGQDQSLVYQRHQKTELIARPFPFISFYSHRDDLSSIRIKTHHIGFCGNVYTCLEMVLFKYDDLSTKESRKHRRFCYTIEDVDSFVKSNFKEKDYENYLDKRYKNIKNSWFYNDRRFQFETFFKKNKEYKTFTANNAAPFFGNSHPIFVAEQVYEKTCSGKFVYDCSLKQYEFYRIFPPFQAFQEINMWLSNQASPIKPIPEMTDKVKLESKGFDKWSFRKESTKKRKK